MDTVTSRLAREDIQRKIKEALASKPATLTAIPVAELNRMIGEPTHSQQPFQQNFDMPKVMRNGKRSRFTRPQVAFSPHFSSQEEKVAWLANMASHSVENKVRDWLGDDGDHYLVFGGTGDALLILAVCWNNPNAKVVFFVNECSWQFSQDFFNLFRVQVFMHRNVMGTRTANYIYEYMTASSNFRASAHLAERLDYGDWINDPEKYKARLVTKCPEWIDYIGRMQRPEGRVVAVCPRGSDQDAGRQRYLLEDEYNALVQKYVDRGDYVYTIGSEGDLNRYKLFRHEKCFWLTSRRFINHQGLSRPHTLKDLLGHVNVVDEVVSTDTWLKTYSLLVGIPTKVIMTRWHGRYQEVGLDASDGIFLNKDHWPAIRMYRYEDLLAEL